MKMGGEGGHDFRNKNVMDDKPDSPFVRVVLLDSSHTISGRTIKSDGVFAPATKNHFGPQSSTDTCNGHFLKTERQDH